MAVAGTFLVAAASLVGFFEVPLCIALFALSIFRRWSKMACDPRRCCLGTQFQDRTTLCLLCSPSAVTLPAA
jgi:hypothetical protein